MFLGRKFYATAAFGKHVNYEVKNGVAVLKIDSPNSKVNTLNVETMTEMKEAMDTLVKDSNINAIVVMSGKKNPRDVFKSQVFLLKHLLRET